MSFPRYPAYKDSEAEQFGLVPQHWDVTRLKNVALIRVSTVDKHIVEDEIPVFVCHYVQVYYNRRINRSVEFVNGSVTSKELEEFKIRNNDVVITKDSEIPEDIAVATLVAEDIADLVCGYHLAILRPNHLQLYGMYLYYLQESRSIRAYYTVTARGVTRYGLTYDGIANTPVLLPPLPEQRAIAAFLDTETARIDTLVAKQEALIAMLQEKRRALISHAVTKGLDPAAPMKDSGVPWLGEVPAHWEVKRLKHCFLSMEQGWSPQCENRPAEDHEWGVLKVGCVNGDIFNPFENKALPIDLEPILEYTLRKNDVLISRANTRELVGSAAVVTRDYPNLLLCDKLYRLRIDPDLSFPEFITLLLRTPLSRSQIEIEATGASQSMQNIAQDTIRNLPFALPPLKEQHVILTEIREQTQHLDTLIAKAEQFIALLREHRAALIAAAVTGQIDVRGYVAEDAPASV